MVLTNEYMVGLELCQIFSHIICLRNSEFPFLWSSSLPLYLLSRLSNVPESPSLREASFHFQDASGTFDSPLMIIYQKWGDRVIFTTLFALNIWYKIPCL